MNPARFSKNRQERNITSTSRGTIGEWPANFESPVEDGAFSTNAHPAAPLSLGAWAAKSFACHAGEESDVLPNPIASLPIIGDDDGNPPFAQSFSA